MSANKLAAQLVLSMNVVLNPAECSFGFLVPLRCSHVLVICCIITPDLVIILVHSVYSGKRYGVHVVISHFLCLSAALLCR